MSDDLDWDNLDSEGYSDYYSDTKYSGKVIYRQYQGALWQLSESQKEANKRKGMMVFDFFGHLFIDSAKIKRIKIGAILIKENPKQPKRPTLRIYNISKKDEEIGVVWLSKSKVTKKNPRTLIGKIDVDKKKYKLLAWITSKDQRKAFRKRPALRLQLL